MLQKRHLSHIFHREIEKNLKFFSACSAMLAIPSTNLATDKQRKYVFHLKCLPSSKPVLLLCIREESWTAWRTGGEKNSPPFTSESKALMSIFQQEKSSQHRSLSTDQNTFIRPNRRPTSQNACNSFSASVVTI